MSLDQRTRGMGGLLSSCGEENLVDLDTDPRYAGRDILTHEFAHCVMDFGLPPAIVSEIHRTWEHSVNVMGRWKRSDGATAYAGSCAAEYWAELTMWCAERDARLRIRATLTPRPARAARSVIDQVLWHARRVCGPEGARAASGPRGARRV